MTPEEIKVGEKYKLELLCILNKENVIVFETPTGDHIPLRSSDFECVSPANGTKNAETAPKYDPNHKFRKGDIVEPCKGREVYACEWEDCVFHKLEGTYEVQADEKEGHVTVLEKVTGVECYVSVFALELVTPVEDLEPYSVKTGGYNIWSIKKGDLFHSQYPFGEHCVFTMEEAKAAAEAECARLNAEHRKEHNND